ncbi:MAG: hypothetical protein V3S24_17820, partial [Candidatus Tectomicrobia bacterium]
RGIGPIYAERLKEAGIMTFAALTALTPERIREIVTTKDGSEPLIDPQDWIVQARAFASNGGQQA